MEPKKEMAWEMYIEAVSKIIVETGFSPVPVYKDIFREASLSRYAEIEMAEAGEKELSIAKEILSKKPIDIGQEKV